MRGLRFILAAALLAAAAAPAPGAPRTIAEINQDLAQSARWMQQLTEAFGVAAEGLPEVNERIQALVATNPQQARAAVPAFQAAVAKTRSNIQRSNGMLDALLPAAAGLKLGMPPERLIADARQQNDRVLGLLDSYDVIASAIGRGDVAAIRREQPKLAEGSLALVAGQRLILRSRQALYQPTDWNRQTIGVGVELYRLMEISMRGWMIARDPAAAEKAAASLREQSAAVLTDLRAIAAAGRKNLDRDLAELDAERKRPGIGGEERRLLDRLRDNAAIDQGTFDIADRIAAVAERNSKLSAAQLRQTAATALIQPLVALEDEYMSLNDKGIAGLAEAPPRP